MFSDHRVKSLRKEMTDHQIDAYIIPSSDPHQSEYVANHWSARKWISGFSGSAGTAVVSSEDAGVWTDSRYFIQAEKELADGPFHLHKVYNQGSPQYIDWLVEQLKDGDVVGCDGRLFSKQQLSTFKKKLSDHNIDLKTEVDLISLIWEDRPSLPLSPIFHLEIEYSGESCSSKLKRIRAEMKKANAQYHLISTLDDLAWTFNYRGNDVEFNPVAYAYALISQENANLYIHPDKVDNALEDILYMDGVNLRPYDQIWTDLNELPESDRILIDEKTISYSLFRSINCKHVTNQTLPSIKFKAIKNIVEIQHFRNVMIKDGVALVRFYRWLESEIANHPTEYELSEKLKSFRAEQPGYFSESFNAIVGYKGNGAIVHYRPSAKDSAKISDDGVLLVDSGGQYKDGTTDITRTISLGNPTDKERDAYTRVLKGHISLDRAVFPEGTLGVQLDTLARIHLWHNRMNYLHGTGHGIGFFLNVHEGPQGFYPGIAARSRCAIEEYMITTNEPGYYEEGKFGIRIENCLLTVKAGNGFLKFEPLTLFPIDTQLISMEMLTRDEVKWLNAYHQKVFNALAPHLNEKESKWLKIKCADI